MKILKNIWNYIRPKSQRELQEEWLASSHDLVELEKRQKQLINPNLKGWV
jgi:hypothetical protein|tara:strand:+ start:479 stop:628 length:150 start_codon:yes stop_codon:yes gene_type:complete